MKNHTTSSLVCWTGKKEKAENSWDKLIQNNSGKGSEVSQWTTTSESLLVLRIPGRYSQSFTEDKLSDGKDFSRFSLNLQIHSSQFPNIVTERTFAEIIKCLNSININIKCKNRVSLIVYIPYIIYLIYLDNPLEQEYVEQPNIIPTKTVVQIGMRKKWNARYIMNSSNNSEWNFNSAFLEALSCWFLKTLSWYGCDSCIA